MSEESFGTEHRFGKLTGNVCENGAVDTEISKDVECGVSTEETFQMR